MPRSAVEGGLVHLPDGPQHHPIYCDCSPFCHSNELSLAQKSKLNNHSNLSNGKGDNSTIKIQLRLHLP
jgi:hypothetical protein